MSRRRPPEWLACASRMWMAGRSADDILDRIATSGLVIDHSRFACWRKSRRDLFPERTAAQIAENISRAQRGRLRTLRRAKSRALATEALRGRGDHFQEGQPA